MRLRSLIKNQVLSIDDHKWGCQEEKKWDFKHCDIHVDKRTNFPINGKIREVQIKIPINSNRPIEITNKKNGNKSKLDDIPNNLKKEIENAFSNDEIRNAFVVDVYDVLINFSSKISDDDKAKETLMKIAKHFNLGIPTETIPTYVDNVLSKYSLKFKIAKDEEYTAEIQKGNIKIGQF